MMTRDEVKEYIELHGDAKTVIDTIKQMQAEGIEVTEQALDERLSLPDDDDYLEEYEEEEIVVRKPKFLKVALLAVGIGMLLAMVGFAVMIRIL